MRKEKRLYKINVSESLKPMDEYQQGIVKFTERLYERTNYSFAIMIAIKTVMKINETGHHGFV